MSASVVCVIPVSLQCNVIRILAVWRSITAALYFILWYSVTGLLCACLSDLRPVHIAVPCSHYALPGAVLQIIVRGKRTCLEWCRQLRTFCCKSAAVPAEPYGSARVFYMDSDICGHFRTLYGYACARNVVRYRIPYGVMRTRCIADMHGTAICLNELFVFDLASSKSRRCLETSLT